jgi:hypothetical protein
MHGHVFPRCHNEQLLMLVLLLLRTDAMTMQRIIADAG